jgi:hypothetical protein
MRVPDFILRCVGFLGDAYSGSDGIEFDANGTVFIVTIKSSFGGSYWYAVTAKHLVDDKPFQPTIALNSAHRGERILLDSILVGDERHWYFNPIDESADIAVTPVMPVPGIDLLPIPCPMLLTPRKIEAHNIGIGDDVFFPGFFEKAPGRRKNTPILRRGNLAMLPREEIEIDLPDRNSEYRDVYLVESHSIGGLSGSPVFVRETVHGRGKNTAGKTVPMYGVSGCERSGFHLLGLNSGHFKVIVDRGVENAGIAYVTPSHKILEALDHPELLRARIDNELALRDRRDQMHSSPDRGR